MSMIFYENSSPLEIVTIDQVRQAMAAAPARYAYLESMFGAVVEGALAADRESGLVEI